MSLRTLVLAAMLSFAVSNTALAQDNFATNKQWMDVEVGQSSIQSGTRPMAVTSQRQPGLMYLRRKVNSSGSTGMPEATPITKL